MKPEVFIRGPFNYDVDEASVESGLECKDESLAVQSQKDESDINVIVKRFGVTGMLPQVPMPPSYEDFTESVSDYRTALDLIREADRSFMALPADVRKRFDNDAGAFVAFASDPGNIEELRKMGLAVPKEVANVEDREAGSGDFAPTSGGAAPTRVGARREASHDVEGGSRGVRQGDASRPTGRGDDR